MSRVIADLDDRDRKARADLHLQLRARRQLLGWSQRKVGDACGVDPAGIRRWERLGVDQSYAATIMRWAEPLGLRLVMEPVGFPTVPARPLSRIGQLFAAIEVEMTGRTSAAWRTAAVRADLVRIRQACRVTQAQLADQFRVSEQAVSMTEVGDSSPALVMLQRHARGIARCARRPEAYLAVSLQEDTPLV
jgi:transcriptional regulator with XRE-family HTH domain